MCVWGMWFQLPTTRNTLSLQAAQVVDRTSVDQLSTFGPILWISKEHIQKKKFKKGYVFQKTIQLTTPVGYTFIIYFKNLPVMKMLVFNFQNMMDMQKDYAYKIFNFVAFKKLIRI